MKLSETDISESLENLSKYAFLLTSIIALAVLIIDLFTLNFFSLNFVINSISIFPIIAIIILFTFKKIQVRWAFMIVTYTLLLNISFTNILLPEGVYTAIFIFRDTPPFLIFLPLVGLIVDKIHTLIIGSFYLLLYLLIFLITRNSFLLHNLITIFVIGAGYSYSMYFLISLLEKGFSKQNQLNKKISIQNQELIIQSANLAEINKLLSVQTNEIRKQQAELYRLNSTKDKIISLIAHDLKNPMATLIGFSEVLSARLESLSSEKKHHYIDLINTSAKNIFDLLENMLDWGRLQSEKIHFNPEKINLGLLITPIIELLSPTAAQKKIILKNLVDKDILVFIDRHMMIAVLRNLIANAIKFTFNNGTIQVITHVSEKKVTISVEDNGMGMSLETIQSLFDADKTITNKGTAGENGTGLGLLVCYEFLERHNSTLRVESQEGKGSTFSFDLPAYKADNEL